MRRASDPVAHWGVDPLVRDGKGCGDRRLAAVGVGDRLLRISCLESKKRKTRRDLFNSGDGALGVRIGKRHIKPFRNGLGDQAQAGSPGFPMNATLGIRWIDGPSQVVPTHQVPTGRRISSGSVGIPSGFEERLPAMHQIAVRGMAFKMVPVQGLGSRQASLNPVSCQCSWVRGTFRLNERRHPG